MGQALMDARGPKVARNMRLLSEGVCWSCEIPLVRAERGVCPACGRDFAIRNNEVYERAPIMKEVIGKPVQLLRNQGCVVVTDEGCVIDGPIPVGAMLEFEPYPLQVFVGNHDN
jgi:hypothetical protein